MTAWGSVTNLLKQHTMFQTFCKRTSHVTKPGFSCAVRKVNNSPPCGNCQKKQSSGIFLERRCDNGNGRTSWTTRLFLKVLCCTWSIRQYLPICGRQFTWNILKYGHPKNGCSWPYSCSLWSSNLQLWYCGASPIHHILLILYFMASKIVLQKVVHSGFHFEQLALLYACWTAVWR